MTTPATVHSNNLQGQKATISVTVMSRSIQASLWRLKRAEFCTTVDTNKCTDSVKDIKLFSNGNPRTTF
ncbi:unnamed protein product [Trichobilharzia szidati]|nr:unnamed protein product [Trichobilharzia szidati]